MSMKTIPASEFKATCLRLMEELAQSGESVLITKHGKPISVLSPYRQPTASLFGRRQGQIVLRDDLVKPVGEEWEAEVE